MIFEINNEPDGAPPIQSNSYYNDASPISREIGLAQSDMTSIPQNVQNQSKYMSYGKESGYFEDTQEQ